MGFLITRGENLESVRHQNLLVKIELPLGINAKQFRLHHDFRIVPARLNLRRRAVGDEFFQILGSLDELQFGKQAKVAGFLLDAFRHRA